MIGAPGRRGVERERLRMVESAQALLLAPELRPALRPFIASAPFRAPRVVCAMVLP